MATSFGALCTDFYINQKLAVKMRLPSERETVLHLFDRVRKAIPSMDRFRRYEGELALESARKDPSYQWMGLRSKSIRSGSVNPATIEDAVRLHRLVLEQAPHHLTISPLDVDHLELLYGFDLECESNHDEVVAEALLGGSPLAGLFHDSDAAVLDVQPMLGVSLAPKGDLQAFFEVRTRRRGRRGATGRYREEPISIVMTIRKYGPIPDINDLPQWFETLTRHADTLAAERLVPNVLTPIARQITSSNA